jgi:ABC-type sugar transport system permease subunit
MTQGGPAGTTRVLSLIIYQTAFSYNRIGRASAMAVVLFLAILSLTLIQSRIYGTRRD